ncbi:MAG: DUF5688 family protein [Lachnospiraceae bacterium]|nr:DUF5688 family protein [Lachnospiraceae bacterium]
MKYEEFKAFMKRSQSREYMTAPKPEKDLSFEDIRARVFYRVDSYKGNESKLMHCPYIPFHDMVITFRWLFEENEEGICSALIENRHMEYWGISEEEVIRQAVLNTPKLFPYKQTALVKMMSDMGEDFPEGFPADFPIQILTNEIGINGASVVLYEGVLGKAFHEIGEDFYLLPSSIHEMLAIGESFVYDPRDLYEMVKEANDTVVTEKDYLSGSVYFYDHAKDRMILVPK